MEIGSEFEWQEGYLNNIDNHFNMPYIENGVFTFSGRTSIEQVLKDISKKERVLLPSYCCDSMIEPFRKADLKIAFYDISCNEGEFEVIIDRQQLFQNNILLLCNYFGFNVIYPESLIRSYQKQGGVVIEDITHSLLSSRQYHEFSDYVVASVRKWGPLLDGGYCSSKKSKLKKCKYEPDNSFLQKKKLAMVEKYEYLQGYDVDKSNFLTLFNLTNHIFSDSYSDTAMSEISYEMFKRLPIQAIKEQRLKNAKVLYRELVDLKEIKFLFSIQDIDCPLFIPILLDEKHRSNLRSYLINNDIYCPVHWPKSKDITYCSIYDKELSIVCDQRYREEDMIRIANSIKEYFGY